MTQEEKQFLLLQDLCARLPYGVIVNTPKGDGYLGTIKLTIFGNEYGVNIKATERDYFNDNECELRPYLRTMSSMTEEEKKQWLEPQIEMELETLANDHDDMCFKPTIKGCTYCINWLNKNMFDFRGLIEKGLAIEVTEENNPYK